MTQNEALAILKTGANVFLTGEPGSGKTYTVYAYIGWLKEHGIQPAVTASTGIAATHLNGFTIHSWSGIRVRDALTKQDLQSMRGNKKLATRVCNARTLIIDEISMLSANTFGLVDAACRHLRENPAPFGGLQVVLVGDFFQLPPVIREGVTGERPGVRQELIPASRQSPAPRFCFDSPSWKALNPTACYLDEQYRQDDPAFLGLLAAIRSCSVEDFHRELLGTRYFRVAPEKVPKLFSHNADVDRVNAAELAKLSGESRQYAMESGGPKPLVDQLKRGCLSPEELHLKIGAPVMFTQNDYLQHQFVNGSLGTVIGFSPEDGCPIIQLKKPSIAVGTSGNRVYADRSEWRIEDGERVLARISQIPLRLAWAMTVHKSQGMSLDAAHIDLRGAFEHGQGYVALSRVRTLAGLTLAGWNERALEVHPDISGKDAEFKAASQKAQADLAAAPAAEILQRQHDFIISSGGTVKANPAPMKRASQAFKRQNTFAATLAFVKQMKSISEIAAARSLKEDTIVFHLEQLQREAKLSNADLRYLMDGREPLFQNIHSAMRKLWAEDEVESPNSSPDKLLKPVFEHFNGTISYETIRLARLLFEEK